MDQVVDKIREVILCQSVEYKKVKEYDFWGEHISFVVRNAIMLASRYDADSEIVELGALLHDAALVSNVGTRAEHHECGAKIAVDLLKKLDYPDDKTERVKECVLHHRSSKNARNVEEICVADADILAHFDNIPMIFQSAFVLNRLDLSEKGQLIRYFEKDYGDLSERTRKWYADRYRTIMGVLFPDYEISKDVK